MQIERQLLVRLLAENPFQPATAWWRAIELAALLRHGMPHGAGLDLGCGDGKLMAILLEASRSPARLVGVDIDPLETGAALASGVYQRVHTVAGDRIPEPHAAFDFVFSNSVLEHIDDLEPVIAETARLLRSAGCFLFTVPAAGFHECLAGPLLGGNRERYLRRIDRRCAHRRYWDEGQWRACLERHGLRVVAAAPYLSAREVQRWENLSRFTAGILYTLARERLQPIDIQRAMQLRDRRLRLPHWVATAFAAAINTGVRGDSSGRFGCLLIEARKTR
ncbi:MAG TPA: class I SAM-dependent methyltransferase [Burkholderiales bacterium]|nr:class I SAM-dependent methyltransferase [Burkholderiales bacterium]